MKNLLLVFANAVEGREEEFNDWYSGRHITETLNIDENFISGQRFRLVDAQMTKDSADAPYHYLAIYEVDDLEAADSALHSIARVERAEAVAAGRTPRHVMSSSMDPELRTWWYIPITDEFRSAEQAVGTSRE